MYRPTCLKRCSGALDSCFNSARLENPGLPVPLLAVYQFIPALADALPAPQSAPARIGSERASNSFSRASKVVIVHHLKLWRTIGGLTAGREAIRRGRRHLNEHEHVFIIVRSAKSILMREQNRYFRLA